MIDKIDFPSVLLRTRLTLPGSIHRRQPSSGIPIVGGWPVRSSIRGSEAEVTPLWWVGGEDHVALGVTREGSEFGEARGGYAFSPAN